MSEYAIVTDSSCDVSYPVLAEWGVKAASLTFRFGNSDKDLTNEDMPIEAFYAQMKAGGVSKTSAPSPDAFRALFEPALKAGKDILYIGFSSGLSATVDTGRLTADELAKEYPQRRIEVVDTLCASAGQGLVVYAAVKKKEEGASFEECAAFVRELSPKVCHWFTVDDLVYLKRGGRVSPAVAFAGALLGIKPVMHVDNAGKLVNVTKARGRKAALKALADKYTELATDKENGLIFISQADCRQDAQTVADLIAEATGNKNAFITDIGPVIGSHAGPGTVALFFAGSVR